METLEETKRLRNEAQMLRDRLLKVRLETREACLKSMELLITLQKEREDLDLRKKSN